MSESWTEASKNGQQVVPHLVNTYGCELGQMAKVDAYWVLDLSGSDQHVSPDSFNSSFWFIVSSVFLSGLLFDRYFLFSLMKLLLHVCNARCLRDVIGSLYTNAPVHILYWSIKCMMCYKVGDEFSNQNMSKYISIRQSREEARKQHLKR